MSLEVEWSRDTFAHDSTIGFQLELHFTNNGHFHRRGDDLLNIPSNYFGHSRQQSIAFQIVLCTAAEFNSYSIERILKLICNSFTNRHERPLCTRWRRRSVSWRPQDHIKYLHLTNAVRNRLGVVL